MLLASMNWKNESFIFSLYFLGNGPQYETKADAIKISPIIRASCSSYSLIFIVHLSLELPKAFVNLLAKDNLFLHFVSSATASFNSFSAFSFSAITTANSAFN